MKIKEISNYLESLAPLATQESYDNCGLIVGNFNDEINSVLVSLDCTEEIVDEAIAKGCQLIVSHHPIVFSGLKKLNGKNYVERTVIKAIKNDIAIYAIHTNLDNYRFGVNYEIGQRIGLKNIKTLRPVSNSLLKLQVMVPQENAEILKNALFQAGAGSIGEYDECSFELQGIGNFKPNKSAQPHIGEAGKRETVKEVKLEMVLENHKKSAVLKALFASHPYEEVAYDLIRLENNDKFTGAGMIGTLDKPEDAMEFLKRIKEIFACGIIKYTSLPDTSISKVAYCGGAGSFLIKEAKNQKADIFITGDLKYHEYFDAENEIVICDIGHYESEQFTTNLLADKLKEKFTNFAVHLTGLNTNPINYV